MNAAPLRVVHQAGPATSLLDPTRLRILRALEHPDSAAGLARRLGVPRQKLNYHLRLLENEGLVELVEERKKRNCTERVMRAVARSYLISPAALGALAANPDRIEDRASSAYLVATAARVITEVSSAREGAERAGKKLPTLTLHADVRFASQRDQAAFAEELTRVVSEVIGKFHDERAPHGRAFRVMAGAWPVPPADSAK
ncbi:MAG TPA: helix-turn-helix domain-containing protein [Gemmatimonadales bacterium]|nr:helix-turn-helix domain-containing protein [Gemmatimonadales bacterium]